MSFRRAVQPLDPDALAAANAAVEPETGGRPLRMDETELRKKWMDAYVAAGGKVEEVGPKGKKPKDPCEPCKTKKSVTARIATVTFRSDHLGSAGAKLIKRAVPEHVSVKWKKGVKPDGSEDSELLEFDSLYGDGFTEFRKPEWDEARGGSSDSHPISHTKNQNVHIDIEIEFTVTPDGETATLTEVKGKCPFPHLTFEKSISQTVGTERVTVTGLVSKDPLPNYVDRIEGSIDWTAEVDGEEKSIGTTGSHVVYVTLDQPFGKMGCPSNNSFQEIGSDQVVTEDRLRFSVEAARITGETDEQECVDAIFTKLGDLGVNYTLDRRWLLDQNHTGVLPNPSVHHYLWLCNTHNGQGECHNIAAAMALACRILGVKGAFEVGYMYPWPSRNEDHPIYSKSTAKSPGGTNILGKYNIRYTRNHSAQSGHGDEALGFLDGRGFGNNFEGVVAYKNSALYAIGDAIFDISSDPNDNASSYYADRQSDPSGIRIQVRDWNKGWANLTFWNPTTGAACPQPYPWITTSTTFSSGETHAVFHWED